MKTLLVTFDFPPMVTGIGTLLYNLWRHFPVEDSMILAPLVSGAKSADAAMQLRIVRYPAFMNWKVFRGFILLPYIWYYVFSQKIKLVICAVPVSIGVAGLITKKLFGTPYCIFFYGGEKARFAKSRSLSFLLNVVLRNASGIFINSEFSVQEVLSFGLERKNIYKVLPVIDAGYFRPGINTTSLRSRLGIGEKKVLLTVARLVRRKGVHAVIAAMPFIKESYPEVVYLVVGIGKEEANLRALAREKGVAQEVIFIGHVSDEELPVYYNLCDIYVMPNVYSDEEDNIEGFGISFVEASSCAKPVIGGISGGVADAVVHEQTGILVDPLDLSAVANAVIRLLQEPLFACALGAQGRKRVEVEFCATRVIPHFQETLCSVAER